MKRALVSACILAAAVFGAWALDVDVEELKSAGTKVEFINYSGPVNIFQTDFDIRGIGRTLASRVARGAESSQYLLKYSAIHIADASEPDKFGADIISLDKDAKVDHVSNVRRITSAYVEALYKYSKEQSDLLALLVSYYNAIYRGDLAYFKGKYKATVIAHLDANKVGISTKYYEWPGNTQLVIPLREGAARAALGPLSTTELASKEVIDQLKAQEDKGIAERTAIVEQKQTEVDQGRAQIDAEVKRLEEQKKATAAQEAALAQARKDAAALKAEEDRKAAAAAIKAQEEQIARQKAEQQAAQASIAAKEAAVQEQKAEIVAEKKDIQADQTALKIQQEPQAFQQELAAKSDQLAQREAEVAAREEAARKGETDAAVFGGKLYYLKIKEYLTGGHYNNDMLLINASTGALITKAQEAGICGRKYDIFKSGVVVITYKGDHREGHYLTLLDLDTLAQKAIGAEPVFFRGFVEIRDDFIFAILEKGNAYYLGKFDGDMKLVASSQSAVDGDSFVSFFGDLVYINSADKKILVLNRDNLSTRSVIEP